MAASPFLQLWLAMMLLDALVLVAASRLRSLKLWSEPFSG